MKEVSLELHRVDGWEALYVNGECFDQDHDGRLHDWLFHCTKAPVTITHTKWVYHEGDAVDDFAMSRGRLPETLEELNSL